MSHVKIKTKYNTEGNYGIIEEEILYCDHNNCSDHVTFYYSDGTPILTVPDTLDNNILDAINRLYFYYNDKSENGLNKNIDYMTNEDFLKTK